MRNTFHRSLPLLAAALLGPSTAAWALTPADGVPDITLYVPGSQANDPNFVPALCLTGTVHTYFGKIGTGATTNNNYTGWYCSTNSTKISGLTGTKKIWISRRRLGASFVGLDGVQNNRDLSFLDPVASNCTLSPGTFTSAGVTFSYDYSCQENGLPTHKPTAATSDITPDVFHGADNVTPGFPPINAGVFTDKHAIAGHIVGIAVTKKLRDALQYVQSHADQPILPATCAAGDDTNPACVPTLSKQQLTTLFSGKIIDWSLFSVKMGGAPVDIVTAAGGAGLAPADSAVHICRRENGAGQQVAVLANVLQSPCLGSASVGMAKPTGTNPPVVYATSLGAVDNCLSDLNDGPSATGTFKYFGTTNPAPYPNPPASTTGNQWGIGMQTTERNANRAANYRFIKIDGALPTGEQAFLGHYPLVSEYGLSWITGPNAPAGSDIAKALNALAAYSKLASTVASRNTALSNHYFGQAGYVALSSNGETPPQVWDPAQPITPYTHTGGGVTDACAVPTVDPVWGAELR
jgi:hypothetical protein